MSAVQGQKTSLHCKRPRPTEMPVAMHYPRLLEPSCYNQPGSHHQANSVQLGSRAQVSWEDAEILMATAHHTNIAGQTTYGHSQTSMHRSPLNGALGPLPTSEARHLPEPQASASGLVLSPEPDHDAQLNMAESMPAAIQLPEASPPVKVPKGARSNRMRKKGSSPAGADTKPGLSAAKALGVKKKSGTSKVKKTTRVQGDFLKSFRPTSTKSSEDCNGILLLLEACDALAANPLLAGNPPYPYPPTRYDDWAVASPVARGGGSEHVTRRVNLMREGYEAAPTAPGRRTKKPLDDDFLYYGQAESSMECDGQRSCEEAKGRGCGVEEGFWNPGGRRRGSRGELQGPCNHCFAEDSPQWRKGPRCKPVLCNACGTRFLRTRSLGKVRNSRSKVREVQQSRFAEPSLNDMMDEDVDMDYTVTGAHAWAGSVKNDSLAHEQDNMSSSTTVPGMGYGNVHHHHFANHKNDAEGYTVHEDCAFAAVSQ